ncbi:MAG: alpha/beta hydrolase, partial [Micromonosporaceae bacterium]
YGKPVVMTARVIERPDGTRVVQEFSARGDRGLARTIRRELDQPADPRPQLPPDLPPALAQVAAGSPADVHTWWQGLGPTEQQRLLQDRPEWIGSLDGIPAQVRDQVNRDELRQLRDETEARRQDLEQRREEIERHRDPDGARQAATERMLSWIDGQLRLENSRLKHIADIETRLHQPGPDQQPAYLLGFQPQPFTGGVQAIVAVNNPDTADHLATVVHGLNSNHYAATALEWGDAMAADARDAATDKITSIITWLGYDAPQGLKDGRPVPITMPDGRVKDFPGPDIQGVLEAGSLHYARQAADNLRRFQDGLLATHQGDRPNRTVVGHSYGSVTVGLTAAGDLGLDADQLILLGSPGVPAKVAERLGKLWASRAYWDVIGNVAGSTGADPVAKKFRARVFSGDPGHWLRQDRAHGNYWNAGNPARQDMAHVITGQPDQVGAEPQGRRRPVLQSLVSGVAVPAGKLLGLRDRVPPSDLFTSEPIPEGHKPRLSVADKGRASQLIDVVDRLHAVTDPDERIAIQDELRALLNSMGLSGGENDASARTRGRVLGRVVPDEVARTLRNFGVPVTEGRLPAIRRTELPSSVAPDTSQRSGT